MSKPTKILSVDFQKEFAAPEGLWFNPGESVGFIKHTLVPFLRENHIRIAEIISDYRQPRLRDTGDGCHPGQPGYESEIPGDVKQGVWIKCMNSPIWIRENIGDGSAPPGVPYQAPALFTAWLNDTVGKPADVGWLVLIGLTVDWCVHCTAQELWWRGYDVRILKEGTDAVGGDPLYKEQLLTQSPVLNWAKPVVWDDLKARLLAERKDEH